MSLWQLWKDIGWRYIFALIALVAVMALVRHFAIRDAVREGLNCPPCPPCGEVRR